MQSKLIEDLMDKFTDEVGRVEVTLEQVDPYVQITVRDTGRGVSPEFMPYLFERYQQADASGARRRGGLGLGLTLVRQLVEMHGCSVTAESEGEGKGATFTFKLPVRALYTAETERAPKPFAADTTSRPGRSRPGTFGVFSNAANSFRKAYSSLHAMMKMTFSSCCAAEYKD